MKIPLLDLKAQHEAIEEEIFSALTRVIRSQKFILGPEVRELEELIASYTQTRFAVGVSSGTDALLISLMALGIGPEDEVITTPYSFFATAGVIARLGAKPVFADIDPLTFNLDPEEIEKVITPRTRAIIPVHLYGQCAEMEPILSLAGRHDLAVIEDAAQAIGAEYRDGRRSGSMGLLGCFSFFPTKNLGALGDAGMVVTRDNDLAEKIRILRVHGAKPKYYHSIVGGNFRLDTLQAAVLKVKLNYLDHWTEMRRKNVADYKKLFQQSKLIEKRNLILPEAVYEEAGIGHPHIYNQFVIRVSQRNKLMKYLKEGGIATEIYYPLPLHLQECFQYLGYQEGDFPRAEKAAKENLALPVYPGLTPAMQEEVVARIEDFYERKGAE